MVNITIDNKKAEVAEGTTILDAAKSIGIEIPTMCFLEGCKASTSCMVCVVRVNDSANLVPACATVATEGMQIESDSESVHEARRTALELLLSDHVGDCMGPCQVGCPATMDIPLMIRQIAAEKFAEALKTVKRDIALPAALGRVCPAPCERICRRNSHDGALSICLLKKFVADVDLETEKPFVPKCESKKSKSVAIVGAGPAGLSCAYYLAQKGYACTIYDDQPTPGGGLKDESLTEKLPGNILASEIATLMKTGIELKSGTKIGSNISWSELSKSNDALFIATGSITAEEAQQIGLTFDKDMVTINKGTYETNIKGIFAGGNVAGPKRHLAVRAVADGKEAAVSIDQYLCNREITGPTKAFNSKMGKMLPGETELFLANVSKDQRVEPENNEGLNNQQAITEAKRCLHCDCRKPDNCKLRDYSQAYGAKVNRYRAQRRTFVQYSQHADIIYEPGKCIDCGLCIQIAEQHSEKLGLTFIGRGFDVKVAVPFDYPITEGLEKAAIECVKACPTGALAAK